VSEERYHIVRIKPDSRRIWVEVYIWGENVFHREPFTTLPTEQQMSNIQIWCHEHACGRRMSFQQFVFKTEKELNMFMLRWA
jgi:hypothetical protein